MFPAVHLCIDKAPVQALELEVRPGESLPCTEMAAAELGHLCVGTWVRLHPASTSQESSQPSSATEVAVPSQTTSVAPVPP